MCVESAVDNLFEQGGEAFVNPEAKVIAEVVALLNLLVSAFTVRHSKFVGIPLSESCLSLVILDLLSNECCRATRVKLEDDSVLTDMDRIRRILGC